MESRRKSAKRPAKPRRTPTHSTGVEMVRATSIFSGLNGHMDTLVDNIANWYAGRLGPLGSFSAWQMMSPWRRLACHIAPFCVAAILGLVLMLVYSIIGDRYNPRSIITTQVMPATSAPGTFVSIIYLVKDNRECYGTVHRWIVDAKGLTHAISDTSVFYNYVDQFRLPYEFSRDFRIPHNVAEGPATYHAKTERWCNVLQELFWPITDEESAPFTVAGTSHSE